MKACVTAIPVLYLGLVLIFGFKKLQNKIVMRLSPKKGDEVWTQLRDMGLKKQRACHSLFMIRSLALLVS